jgi:hypothetical protein
MTPDEKEEIQQRIRDKHLDRIARMLEQCIEELKADKRKRRKLERSGLSVFPEVAAGAIEDSFDQKRNALAENWIREQQEKREESRKRLGRPDTPDKDS